MQCENGQRFRNRDQIAMLLVCLHEYSNSFIFISSEREHIFLIKHIPIHCIYDSKMRLENIRTSHEPQAVSRKYGTLHGNTRTNNVVIQNVLQTMTKTVE